VMWWMGADVGDQCRFPSRMIPVGDDARPILPTTQRVTEGVFVLKRPSPSD
jgi:hypothetical protein